MAAFLKLIEHPNGVYQINLTGKLNIIELGLLNEFNAALDKIEATEGPLALILTADAPTGVFSAGLSLKVLSQGGDAASKMVDTFSKLLKRMVTFPCPTIAIVRGKCIAGGTLLSLCFDYRIAVDSADTFFHLNEIENGFPLNEFLCGLAKAKIGNPLGLVQLCAFGLQINAKEAVRLQICHETSVSAEEAFKAALQKATAWAPKAKHRAVMSSIKSGLWSEISKL